jgi:tetratricopeptide (TPR) repeat protein
MGLRTPAPANEMLQMRIIRRPHSDLLKNRREREYIAPQYIAEIYLALNRTREACDWFERALEEHNPLHYGDRGRPAL